MDMTALRQLELVVLNVRVISRFWKKLRRKFVFCEKDQFFVCPQNIKMTARIVKRQTAKYKCPLASAEKKKQASIH